jgi:hypothetical protein
MTKRACDQMRMPHRHCKHGHAEDCPNPGYCSLLPKDEDKFADSFQTVVMLPTCSVEMPHEMNRRAPESCPPNCPTRLAAEQDRQDKTWPPTDMEAK